MNKYQKSDQAVILAAFARVDVLAFMIALGAGFALMAFAATAALLLQSYTSPILPQLPGYEISWRGSLVGAFYFGLLGMLIGFIFSVFWNLIHILYITLVVVRANWWHLMAD